MIIPLIVSVYVILNVIVTFRLLYDDILAGGDGRPEHPFAFFVVMFLLGLPIILVLHIVDAIRRNRK